MTEVAINIGDQGATKAVAELATAAAKGATEPAAMEPDGAEVAAAASALTSNNNK